MWKNRRARESKLVIALELLLQVPLCFTELAAVALVEDEDHLLIVNWQVAVSPHQVVQFLNRGDDDLVVVFLDIPLQSRRAVGTIDAVGREALVFLHCLVIEVFSIHDKEHLINELQLGRGAGGLETGERLA